MLVVRTVPDSMQNSFYLVIGSGSIARRHIKNLKTLFPHTEVACVSASGRTLTSEECSADVVFNSIFDVLAKGKPEFAVIASPAPFHLEQAKILIESGIPTLIEKPLAESLCSALRNVEALLQEDVRVDIAYNLRYLPSAQEAKRVMDSGVLGRIHSVLIDVGQYLPDWRPQSDYRQNVSARQELGGGVLLELSHELDYMTWLFGRFEQAYCVADHSGRLEIDVEDCVDAILSRRDGMVAVLHMDFLQRVTNRSCKVIGEHGTLRWDLASNAVFLLLPGKGEEMVFSDQSYDRNKMYLAELERFARVAKGELPPAVTVEEGLYVLRLVDALKASAQSRQPVSIESLQS